VDENQLRELIRLLKKEGLTEITICEGDERITVRQDLAAPRVPPIAQPSSVVESEPQPPVDDGTFPLTSPLVGTFYSRPSPEDEPFVAPGAIVAAGDVVGIIEAMKVMNEVHAEEPGKVRRILVEEGQAVEYGQELVLLERL